METSNIIALVLGGIGFLISIISLVLTPRLMLKSKQLEKRLEFRFELFQKILELRKYAGQQLPKHDIGPLLTEINILIQLYGYNSEIKLFKEVGNSYMYYVEVTNEENKQKLKKKIEEFFLTSFNTYRNEIVLGKLED